MPRPETEHSDVVVLIGNPRPASRTTAAAQAFAEHLAPASNIAVVELSALAGELLAPNHPRADGVLEVVAGARLLIVATPVYKASYTGLLKAFLDLYGPAALRGVVAVPFVVSASPAHQFVGETHLRPLLVELGASVPTGALALTESQLGDLPEAFTGWSAAWHHALASLWSVDAGTLRDDGALAGVAS